MNWDQIYSLLRGVMLSAGAGLVAKGYLTEDMLNGIIGLIIGGVSIALSQIFHMNAGQSIVANTTSAVKTTETTIVPGSGATPTPKPTGN